MEHVTTYRRPRTVLIEFNGHHQTLRVGDTYVIEVTSDGLGAPFTQKLPPIKIVGID